MNVVLAAAAATLFAVGTYLVLQRQLSRIVIGIGLLGHGANVLFVLASQGRGQPPFVGEGDQEAFTDPLPQALVLTAIVITFGVTAFLLALAYRSWIVTHDDEVEDDVEDRIIRRRAREDGSDEEGTGPAPPPGAETHAPVAGDRPEHLGAGSARPPHGREDSA